MKFLGERECSGGKRQKNIYSVDIFSIWNGEVDRVALKLVHWENLISAFWQECPLSSHCSAESSVGSSSSSSVPASAVLCLSPLQLLGEIVRRRGWQVEFWGLPTSHGSPAPPSVGVVVCMPLKEAGLSAGEEVGGFVDMCFASLDYWERRKFALWGGLMLTSVLALPPNYLNPTHSSTLQCRLRAPYMCQRWSQAQGSTMLKRALHGKSYLHNTKG